MTALVVVPMRVERIALGRRLPGVVRVGWGPRRWDRAAATVRAALDRRVHSGLLILGVGGGLSGAFAAGDLVVATELRGAGATVPCTGTEQMGAALRRAGHTVHIGPIQTTDHLVDGTERAVLAATGALAVDTESAVLAGAAGGLPVLAVRAVSDTPDRPLRSAGVLRSGLVALRSLHAAGPVLAGWAPIEEEVG